MKNHILLLIMIACISITGCKRIVVESRNMKTYKIVEVRGLILEDDTGKRTGFVYVSKNCHRWNEVKVGTIVTLPVTVMRYEDNSERWVSIDARSVCPSN